LLPDQAEPTFSHDNGPYYVLICGGCESEDKYLLGEGVCKSCGKNFVYRSWWEW
jgi:hypothetical protein